MNKYMDVVFCCDESYVEHLSVAIVSLYANAKEKARLRCWVLSTGFSSIAQHKVEAVGSRFETDIRFVTIDKSLLSGAPVTGHLSIATYYRILIPAVLPETVRKVLYLDCDLVVEADVGPLFEVEMGSYCVGAIINPGFGRWDQLGIKQNSGYFNAGVLLIDLPRWKTERVSQRVLDYIKSNADNLIAHDQDALNAVLAGAWVRLDPRWNQQSSFVQKGRQEFGLTTLQWKTVLRAPYIIHYSSSSKPWHYRNDHPMGRRYHKYRDLAGLPPLVLRPHGIRDVLVKLMKNVLPHRLRGFLGCP